MRVLRRFRHATGGVVIAVLTLAPIAGAVGQQSGRGRGAGSLPATGEHGVSGRVVDAETGAAIAGANVVVERAPSAPIGHRPATTDADGRFTVAGLPTGSLVAIATAAGYARGFSSTISLNGRGQPADAPLVAGIEIRMWRAVTIAGTVTDENGAPIAGVTIEARQRAPRGRGAILSVAYVATTDRNGAYRFDDLRPTEYVVTALFTAVTMPAASWEALRRAGAGGDGELLARVRTSRLFVPTPTAMRVGDLVLQMFSSEGPAPSPGSRDAEGRPRVYHMTFYPAASSLKEATPIRLAPGAARQDVDFKLAATPGARIAGTIAANGAPAAHVGLRLVAPPDSAAETSELTFPSNYEIATTYSDARGAFTFLGVPPGRYVITTAPAGATPWVRHEITIAGDDVGNVSLELRDGLKVRGRIVFADDPPPPPGVIASSPIALLGSLAGTGTRGQGVAADARGEFTTEGYEPGRYLVLNRPIAGWSLASAMLDGRDVSNVPLELVDRDLDGLVLTYTNRRSTVRGTVRVPEGRAADSLEVRLFPVDYRTLIALGMPSHLPVRQFQSTQVSRTGTFMLLVYMPPGDYFIAATAPGPMNDRSEASFDRLAAMATRISIRAGEPHVVNLTQVAPPDPIR